LSGNERRSILPGMPTAITAYSGTLIAESLRVGAQLTGIPLTVTRIYRIRVSRPSESWTLIDFNVVGDLVGSLAEALSHALEGEGGWYCNLLAADEVIVIFADRIFRYQRGDREARSKVEDYARSVGVPESELDWTG
jgi:hypothetical protein